MEVTSPVEVVVGPIPARNMENSHLPHKDQGFKDNEPSPVGGSTCSPGSCCCTLCTSQCSARGGNLSLDGSTLSSCCCNSSTCSDTSTPSYQDSADSELSCLTDEKKSLDVNSEVFCMEDTGRKSGETKTVYSSLSPKEFTATQTTDGPDIRQMLNQECNNGNSSGELDLKLQGIQDNGARAVDIKIVCAWSLSEGEPGELSRCQLNHPDNHDNPYNKESPTKTICDVRSYWPGNKQVAEVRPLKATLEVENTQCLKKPNKTKDSSLHMSCTRAANDNGCQTEQIEDQQTTNIEKHQGVSVEYGSNSTVVHSDSYTGDVQEIVDNVLRANLPVILLAGASQANAAQQLILYHLGNKTRQATDPSDCTTAANNLNRETDKPSSQSDPPISPKANKAFVDEPQEQTNSTNSTHENYKKNCPEQPILSDHDLISIVTYMVRHLPYCIHRDQRFVLASDVEEVVFANHMDMAGISSGRAFINVLSDVLDVCTVDSQDFFANQCQSAKPNDILVQLQWFTTESFLGIAREKMKTDRQSCPLSKQRIPLLGEVHFENHSFVMVYHYEKLSMRTMIYVPARDLLAAFPQSASQLTMLAQHTHPRAGTGVTWNMRFRLAEAAEARALMRYKGASGRLVPKDGGWCYLTSRSILVHWHDFRHTCLSEPHPRVKPSLRDDQQEEIHHASSKTVSPHQAKQQPASVPAIKVKLRRKSKLEKSRHSPPTHTRGKKRKRSFTKLVRMKKGQDKRVKVKAPYLKVCRTSTPLTTVIYSGTNKAAARTDNEGKPSGPVPFARKEFTYTHPVGKGSPLSTSSSMNETEEQVCKGLWKLQWEVLKLQEEKKKKRSHERKEHKITVKIKNENDDLKENSSSEEEQKMKEQLERVVNSNPFTQSIQSLKMVNQLNKPMEPGNCNLSKIMSQANSRDVMRKNTKNKSHRDSKPNPVKEHGTSMTTPVLTHSEQSPAVEKIKCYLKSPLQTVRNPMYLDSSNGSSLEQAATDSHMLSMASDDSIVHFLTDMKNKKGYNSATGMQKPAKEFNKLSQQMKVPKKATPGIFDNKTAVAQKSCKGRNPKDMTPNQYADNPIAEAQGRILEIIRKQHREKAGRAPVKIEPTSAEHMAAETKDGAITETPVHIGQENLNRTPEFTYRLFPQDAESGPSESGVVVVETEDRTSLPYVMNNGYPYVPLSCTRPLFPLCHCTLSTAVLRKSQRMGKCIHMCSFEEAQILYWEGRHLKMPRITSGDRIVRIDQVTANLCHLRVEVKNEHHDQPNKKGCYGLQLPV